MNRFSDHELGTGPRIMGIVNVTPDSFSDGGKFLNQDKAIELGLQLISEGADILDVGGESTRPGAQPVDTEEEIRRVVPVIEGLKGKARWISIDTRNAKTMAAAIAAGANAINDISALTHDSESIHVARESGALVFFMHMQGNPGTMQINPFYNNVLEEIFNFLDERKNYFETNGIENSRLICDPGIGFGKTKDHNVLLLRNISRFHDLGVPVMIGASRKSFIAKISNDEPPESRLGGSIASVLWALSQGVQVFRVHDVKDTAQAIKTYQTISSS